ncbi:MAG: radical SAM protein [Bacillota bacterium]
MIKAPCKTALYCHSSKWLPFNYDINVYRGCAHRCIYCYAQYAHGYIGDDNFFGSIHAKTNIAEVLRRELPRFNREPVNLGGVTDSYQPAERECALMPGVLKLLADYKVPVILSTKSPLVLRDTELFCRIGREAGAMAAFTVTTMDAGVAALIEPGSAPPAERMAAVKELKKAGLTCGVHMMPVIPMLTDSTENLEAVFAAARDAEADYVLVSGLNLKGATKEGFFESIRQRFPSLYKDLIILYADKAAWRSAREKAFETVRRLRAEYRMPSYTTLKTKPAPEQLSLF